MIEAASTAAETDTPPSEMLQAKGASFKPPPGIVSAGAKNNILTKISKNKINYISVYGTRQKKNGKNAIFQT